jgi:putative amide transporter protein
MAPFYIIATMDDPAVILNASGIFFGFTYLYVGITNVGGFDTSELGWYCLWVAIIAVVYSLFNFFYFADPDFSVI